MKKYKACFYTLYTKDYEGMKESVKKSVYRFYPNITFYDVLIGDYEKEAPLRFPQEGKRLSRDYERVIFIGIDQIMVDKCDELFMDYDVIGVPNNSHYLKKYPDTVNGGLIVSTQELFWTLWEFETQRVMRNRPVSSIDSQEFLNKAFWYEDFTSTVLSSSDTSYGIDAISEYKNLRMREDGLYAGNKKIKVFHAAGEEYKKGPEYLWDKLPEEAVEHLQSFI